MTFINFPSLPDHLLRAGASPAAISASGLVRPKGHLELRLEPTLPDQGFGDDSEETDPLDTRAMVEVTKETDDFRRRLAYFLDEVRNVLNADPELVEKRWAIRALVEKVLNRALERKSKVKWDTAHSYSPMPDPLLFERKREVLGQLQNPADLVVDEGRRSSLNPGYVKARVFDRVMGLLNSEYTYVMPRWARVIDTQRAA